MRDIFIRNFICKNSTDFRDLSINMTGALGPDPIDRMDLAISGIFMEELNSVRLHEPRRTSYNS